MTNTSSRREFFVKVCQAGAFSLVGGTIWQGYLNQSKANAFSLRPPGALPEEDYLATCIKCGICVDACPYDTLSLAKVGEGSEIGVPKFTAREIPCYMCEDVPCARACPTGALDKEIKIEDSRMGLAVLVDKENCIAFQGLRCEICYRQCPLMDKAISLEYRHQDRTGKHAFFEPVVHSDACTGCGICEHACILEETAIRVLPLELAQGKLGENFKFGWQENSEIPTANESRDQSAPSAVDSKALENALDSLNDAGTLYE